MDPPIFTPDSSGRTSRFEFRPAVPADSAEILALLEAEPFPGRISLLYTRRPDPLASFAREGEEVVVIVCRETGGELVGIGACALRNLHIAGEPCLAAYLFSLRGSEKFRGRSPLKQAYTAMREECRRRGVEYTYTTILAENRSAVALLERKRRDMPEYSLLGHYQVQVLTRRRRAHSGGGFAFRRATPEDREPLLRFLNREGRRHHLFPVVGENDLEAGDDFYLLTDRAGEILVAGALRFPAGYKQYVVAAYGGSLRWLAACSRLFPLPGGVRLPPPGSEIDYCTLALTAVRGDDPAVFALFLNGLRGQLARGQLLMLGFDTRSPLARAADRSPVRYQSRLYEVRWMDEPRALSPAPGGLNYLDCGSL